VYNFKAERVQMFILVKSFPSTCIH